MPTMLACPGGVVPDGLRPGDCLLCFYEGDDHGHDRILCCQVSLYLWVICTKHGDIYLEDLREYAGCYGIGPLGGVPVAVRTAPRVRIEQRWYKDNVDRVIQEGREALAELREADGLPVIPAAERVDDADDDATPTGEAPLPIGGERRMPQQIVPPDDAIWVALEKRHGYALGDVIALSPPHSYIDGDRGVMRVPGGSIAIGRVGTLDGSAQGPGDAAAGQDLRTLPVKYTAGAAGQRSRNFHDAAAMLSTTLFPDWPMDGPRTSAWLCGAFTRSDVTPIRRHHWWRQVLSLHHTDEMVSEHEFLSELLELGLTFDQLNAGELLIYESIARRYQLIEEMYAQSLKEKSMGGFGGQVEADERLLFLGKAHSHGTAMVNPELQSWVAARVAEKSAILKERRKGRDEQRLAHQSPAAQDNIQNPPGTGKRARTRATAAAKGKG